MTKIHRIICDHLVQTKKYKKTSLNSLKSILAINNLHRSLENFQASTFNYQTSRKKKVRIITWRLTQLKNHKIQTKCKTNLNNYKDNGRIGILTVSKWPLLVTTTLSLNTFSSPKLQLISAKNFVNTQDSLNDRWKDDNANVILSWWAIFYQEKLQWSGFSF